MKKIWKLTSLITLPSIVMITSFNLNAAEGSQTTVSGIIANAVANNDDAHTSLLLSELEPKAISLCNQDASSEACVEYSGYVNDLKNANAN